jgi:hypothetical protein
MAVASQNLIHMKSHVLNRAIAVFQERLCWQFSAWMSGFGRLASNPKVPSLSSNVCF